MKNTLIKKLICVVLALAVVFSLSLNTYAQNMGDETKTGSLTVNLTDKSTKEPVKDIVFKLYYVASNEGSSESPEYKYTNDFENCNAKINIDDPYFPVHLSYYAKENNLEAKENKTDLSGKAVFFNLKEGLYLVSSENMKVVPFVLNVPENINNELKYDVVAQPKVDIKPETEIKKTIEAEKIWKGENHPESIIAVLLKDGEEYAQAVLSQNNNWYVKWENLSGNSSWQVVEKKVPDGFYVRYETEGNKFIIINTAQNIEETVPQENTTNQNSELEDTGELNWPVPVMAISGILIFSIGWVLLNLKKKSV